MGPLERAGSWAIRGPALVTEPGEGGADRKKMPTLGIELSSEVSDQHLPAPLP